MPAPGYRGDVTSALDDPYRLDGAWNFRDVGGLRTIDGGTTRPGVLFRSSQLSGLTDAARRELDVLGIADVFDLRRNREIEVLGADLLSHRIRLHNTPFEPRHLDDAPHERPTSAEQAVAELSSAYAQFAVCDEAAQAIVRIARAVADGSAGMLVHCAAGKDRTGWLTAVLLRAVGVTEPEVQADYLRSNAAVPDLVKMIAVPPADLPIPEEMLGVRLAYLAAADDAVRDRHGDFAGYLGGIGLNRDLVDRLRQRLVGPAQVPL